MSALGRPYAGQTVHASDTTITVELDGQAACGQYIFPRAARTTFRQYAERWVKTHTGEINSREAVEGRLRLHAYPHIGSRPLGSFKPERIRAWIAALEATVPAESHRRIIVGTVSAALSAAVNNGSQQEPVPRPHGAATEAGQAARRPVDGRAGLRRTRCPPPALPGRRGRRGRMRASTGRDLRSGCR